MKTLIIIIVWFLSLPISAQKKVWLDKDLQRTHSSNASYYKIVTLKGKEVSYYYKNGNFFRKQNYSEGKLEGKFSEFYNTGELKIIGKHENGLREGIWKTYYKNGKIKTRGKYRNGEKVGIWKTFYKNVY
ncbi:MAG: toxin-antitoxin system YwqK family antitoxin [Polaribacter sp.]